MLVCVQRYTLLLLDGWKVIEICHTCAESGLLSCHHPDPASTRPRAWPVSVTVCLVSTKYLHIEGCLLLIMLDMLAFILLIFICVGSVVCCVEAGAGSIVTVDQSISVNISFIFIILSFYMLFTLRYYYRTCYYLWAGEHYISFARKNKINNLLSSVHHSSYQNRYECNGYNTFEIKSQECG